MKVAWTARAQARLRQIHAYIAQDQPLNADRFVDQITRSIEQLVTQSRSGRIVEKYQREDLRELIEPPYRIIYLVLEDRIDIVTVRDTRRMLPRRLDQF